MFGYREYEKNSSSTHNKALNYLTLGGAYHNFHHAFPLGIEPNIMLTWLVNFRLHSFFHLIDYSASEFGIKSFNIYAAFIEFFAWIGWAYDLKKAPQHLVEQRKQRTGGEVDEGAIYKRHTILDWILGWFVSFNVIWSVIVYRAIVYMLWSSCFIPINAIVCTILETILKLDLKTFIPN